MEYVHRCEFCGWSRAAHSAAMTAPLCERCGCGLSSMRRSDEPTVPVSDVELLERLLPRIDAPVVSTLRVAFVALITAAAARAGYAEGGPAIAVAAFGVAGLLAVPIAVPGRYGRARVDPARGPDRAASAGLPPHHG